MERGVARFLGRVSCVSGSGICDCELLILFRAASAATVVLAGLATSHSLYMWRPAIGISTNVALKSLISLPFSRTRTTGSAEALKNVACGALHDARRYQ